MLIVLTVFESNSMPGPEQLKDATFKPATFMQSDGCGLSSCEVSSTLIFLFSELPESSADSPFSASALKVLGLNSLSLPKYSPVVVWEDRYGEDKEVSRSIVLSKAEELSSSFGFSSY